LSGKIYLIEIKYQAGNKVFMVWCSPDDNNRWRDDEYSDHNGADPIELTRSLRPLWCASICSCHLGIRWSITILFTPR